MTSLIKSDIWTYFSRNSLSSFLSACYLWQSFTFKSVVWILFLAPDVQLDWLDSLYLFWVVLSSVRYSQYPSLCSDCGRITVSNITFIISVGTLQIGVEVSHLFIASIPHSYVGSNFWTVVWTFCGFGSPLLPASFHLTREAFDLLSVLVSTSCCASWSLLGCPCRNHGFTPHCDIELKV